MQQYHRRVEEKNRRKIEQLEIAIEKEIFRAKMDFLTNIAYEIRMPRTLIKGPLAEQKNLSYSINLPLAPVFASIDTEAFNKILGNLFSNAVKYAAGLVHVALLPVRKADGCFSIEIKNDGYQIPGEMKDKIFEPFFRLKETEKQKGTGIGLALSFSLVQLHKGSLVLKRRPVNWMFLF